MIGQRDVIRRELPPGAVRRRCLFITDTAENGEPTCQCLVRHRGDETRLADPGLTADEDQTTSSRRGSLKMSQQLSQLAIPADEERRGFFIVFMLPSRRLRRSR